jgi:hypothetical protein
VFRKAADRLDVIWAVGCPTPRLLRPHRHGGKLAGAVPLGIHDVAHAYVLVVVVLNETAPPAASWVALCRRVPHHDLPAGPARAPGPLLAFASALNRFPTPFAIDTTQSYIFLPKYWCGLPMARLSQPSNHDDFLARSARLDWSSLQIESCPDIRRFFSGGIQP